MEASRGERQGERRHEQPHSIGLGAAWDQPDAVGRWTRRFGRPAGLGRGDTVLLVIERPAAASATLNGAPLPPIPADAGPWRHDVTAVLQERNVLVVTPTVPPAAVAGPRGRGRLPTELGDVSLVIVAATAG